MHNCTTIWCVSFQTIHRCDSPSCVWRLAIRVAAMDRGRRPPDMSNFCCLPGRAGGTPRATRALSEEYSRAACTGNRCGGHARMGNCCCHGDPLQFSRPARQCARQRRFLWGLRPAGRFLTISDSVYARARLNRNLELSRRSSEKKLPQLVDFICSPGRSARTEDIKKLPVRLFRNVHHHRF